MYRTTLAPEGLAGAEGRAPEPRRPPGQDEVGPLARDGPQERGVGERDGRTDDVLALRPPEQVGPVVLANGDLDDAGPGVPQTLAEVGLIDLEEEVPGDEDRGTVHRAA